MLSKSRIAPVSNVTRITNLITRIISPPLRGLSEIKTAFRRVWRQAEPIINHASPEFKAMFFFEVTDMEFLIALGIVFVGICAWIHYHGDEVPPDDEDYFSHSNRYNYEDDDSDDGFRHHHNHDDSDDDNDDSDSDDDSDGDSGGDSGDGD